MTGVMAASWNQWLVRTPGIHEAEKNEPITPMRTGAVSPAPATTRLNRSRISALRPAASASSVSSGPGCSRPTPTALAASWVRLHLRRGAQRRRGVRCMAVAVRRLDHERPVDHVHPAGELELAGLGRQELDRGR